MSSLDLCDMGQQVTLIGNAVNLFKYSLWGKLFRVIEVSEPSTKLKALLCVLSRRHTDG